MPSRAVYEVAPRGSEWTVKKRGLERPLHVETTKAVAVEKGVEVARKHAPSQLLIKRADGTIEDERTYGNDPYPPAG